LRQEFAHFTLNADGRQKITEVAKAFDSLLGTLERLAPAGREMSLVRTKLEEASMFARKAVSLQSENQEPGP
jgi:hypothetical protein